MKKTFKILIGFAAILIICISCVENHILPNFGSIFVTSDPLGAQIFLDNENTGKTTPDSIKYLTADEYTISLKIDEFRDTTFTVSVNENSNITKDVYLLESNPQGKIILRSEPVGAEIFLDGINTSRVTPDTLANLGRGTYNITLKLDLYDDINLKIALLKDQTITKDVKMLIAGTSSTLIITSQPSNANYTLRFGSEILFTGVTPDTLKPLEAGNYNIDFSLTSYRDTTVAVSLSIGQTKTSNVIMTFYEPRGSISLSSNPSGAEIYLDDVDMQITTPNNLSKLEAGEYKITLQLAGYYDSTFTATVNEDQNTTVPTIDLRKLPAIGDVVINSDPEGASIYLDDENTGFLTPHTFSKMLVKEYSLTLKLEDFADTTISFQLIKDSVLTLDTLYLRDTVQAVDAIVDYNVGSDQRITFSFTFNQDIRLDSLVVDPPNGFIPTYDFHGQLYPKGSTVQWNYAVKISGNWKFTIYGNKVRGRGVAFEIIETIPVE